MTNLTRVAQLIREAERVVVFTGAGVSAESGMPTFRSPDNGLWRQVDVRNFAYPDGYRRNQPDAWRWYAMRAAKAREIEPNPGHFAIAEMERRLPGLLRPDVVMFEEMLPWGTMERATLAAEDCDLLISVGTSNLVWPAAELPRYAQRAGAEVVIVNPDMEGQPSGRGVTQLVGASGEILPALVRLAWPEPPR